MNLEQITTKIVSDPVKHALWLNTLSMMENTGARKISKYEDPKGVNLTILKHAAEEARHAYYLKKLIEKLPGTSCPDYSDEYLLAPVQSYQYLNQLDVMASKYLKKELKVDTIRGLKHGAYLLVTYAIEVRADDLYGVYQAVLTSSKSKVSVKTIIAEEEGHLQEMRKMLEDFMPDWQKHTDVMCNFENELYQMWVNALGAVVN